MLSADEYNRDVLPVWIAELEATPQFKILNPLVLLDATPSTITYALQEIHKLTSAEVSSRNALDLGNVPWYTFSCVLELSARTLPSKQLILVDFVVQLQKKRVVDPNTGGVLQHHNIDVWTGLPSMDWALEDDWNVDAWNPRLTFEEKQRWENRNAFLAQLTATAEIDYTSDNWCPMDFSLYALRAFRTAFEDDAPSEAPFDTAVRTACWWYIYAVDRMWANVENNRTLRGGGEGGDKHRKKSWRGFNRKRWTIWEDGLVTTLRTCTDGETKKMIEDALACIKRVAVE